MKRSKSCSTHRAHKRRCSRLLGFGVGTVLIGAAVATELSKPPEERTWEGRIAGFVPYDLRRPTLARLRGRVWDPKNRSVLVPTALGVGWTINFGRLLEPWAAEMPDLG
jgi:Family of unknown function (DUF5808)